MTLTQDLLTENRYWTFSSSDWQIRLNIFWGGNTKWSDVVEGVKKHFNDKYRRSDVGYERQVQLKEPELSFD